MVHLKFLVVLELNKLVDMPEQALFDLFEKIVNLPTVQFKVDFDYARGDVLNVLLENFHFSLNTNFFLANLLLAYILW